MVFGGTISLYKYRYVCFSFMGLFTIAKAKKNRLSNNILFEIANEILTPENIANIGVGVSIGICYCVYNFDAQFRKA